ncbi:hypothetical protein H0I23_01160 [Cellulophaga sp. HaHaR_3_176]|uniref:beta strand repeat-containing protein n=1 Tax=Cellulophaga sp. HaHaR_3_176 TaxID=1942464 RepID=UPI001C1F68D9|nr:hypothetical protein [Cellulophaga sp. HaHaR_3_176]QWX84291.1 hypothetical protein H0I23_01160 [Cellulophaga sp. HaHaR_3_176]
MKILIPLAIVALSINASYSQVKVGDNINTIDANSILELESNSKVLVVTRLTTIQMNAISPINGAIVYNLDENCLFQYRSNAWNSLCVDVIGGQTVTTIADNNDGTFSYSNEDNTTVNINKASLLNNNDGTYSFSNGASSILIDTNASTNPYDNSISGLPAITVQEAIDQLKAANDADILALQNNKEDTANKSTDGTLIDNSDTDFPTEQAVKTYVDSQVNSVAQDDDITSATLDTPTSVLTINEGTTAVTVNLSDLEESAAIAAETTRATAAEQANTDAITAETARATAAEQANEDAITAETARATAAEDANEDAITAETARATAAEDANESNIILNDADILALQTDKEDTANKSTDGTLIDNSDTDFPTEQAVKTYVDTQVSEINTLANGSIYIGDNTNTAQEVVVNGDATLTNTGLLTIEDDAVNAEKINADIAGIGITQNIATGALDVDALDITNVITNGHEIARVIEADGTTVQIQETITSLTEVPGSESTLRFTNENGAFSDVSNIVRSVNGVSPAANGNVAVILSSTSTGIEADRPVTANESDIYIVSGEVAPNADRNGVAFIYDDPNGWQEVTTDLSTSDARYVNVNGDAMVGPLAMGNFTISSVADPANPQDAATKNYVDTELAAIAQDDDITGATLNAVNSVLTINEGTTAIPVNLSDLEESADIAAETARATAAEQANEDAITAETARAIAAEDANEANIVLNDADILALQTDKEDTANKSTDGTLIDNSDTDFPTEQAVKTYVDAQVGAIAQDDDITGAALNASTSVLTISEGGTDVTVNLSDLEESADIAAETARAIAAEDANEANIVLNDADILALQTDKEDTANKSTDGTLIDNSDTDFPTEQAVKTYVDTQVGAIAQDDDITGAALNASTSVLTISEGGTDVTVNLSDLEESADIAAETARATAAEQANEDAITAETARAIAAEDANEANIVLNDADILALQTDKEDTANKSTDITLADATNVKFPTELAVKTYVDNQFNAIAQDDDITGAVLNGSSLLTIFEGTSEISVNLSDLEESAEIAAETTRATAAEQANEDAITAETARAIAAEDANEANIVLNDADILALQTDKEDTANKSTDGTLIDNSDTDFPTEQAVKTYVDAQVAATNTLTNGSIFIGSGANTAQEAVISGDATITNTGVLSITDDTVTAAKINADVAGTGLSQNGVTGALEVDALEVTDVIAGNRIATITETNGTSVEIDETITVLSDIPGSEGTLRFTNEAGGFNDITSIVRSVNGVVPAANGNVAVILSSTSTGLEANLPVTAVDSDIYIVSGEVAPNADRNGVAFIFDDATGWQEVTTDISTNDARYVNVNGDAMLGPLSMGNFNITDLNDPTNAQDAATKNYVDALASGNLTSSDINVTGGANSTFTNVSLEIADNAITTAKIADGTITTIDLNDNAVTTAKISDANITTAKITPGNTNQSLVTDNSGTVSWVDNSSLNHSGTTGSVFFAGAGGEPTEDNDELFWDSANRRLGIGTETPTHKLQVSGQVRATSFANADGTANGPAYRFNSDSNTGIYSDGADKIGISTGGTEALIIDASQNVGIGINTPDESLHIANNMRLDGSFEDKDGDAGTSGQVLSSTATGTDWVDPAPAATVSADANNSISAGSDAGIFYESPIKAFAKISSSGIIIKGTSGITITKLTGNGHYRVTLPTGITSDSNYIIQLSQPGRGGVGNDDPGISYNSQTTTSFEVIIGDNDNGGTDRDRYDSEFMFTVLDL